MLFLTLSLLTSLAVVSASPTSVCSRASNEKVKAAWYPGWESATYSVAKIPWDKYTQVTYSFAITTPDVNTLSLDDTDEATLPRFVSLAHENNVTALVSIGGWTGSQYYSTAVGSAENRTAFVKTVMGLVSKYELDGVDFDWEYPNHQGLGCNAISPDDSKNFLSFLQELRKDPTGNKLVLTAATGITPFAGSDGSPMSDVSEFAKVLNYIGIMNYDLNGPWSTTGVGPNAPLVDSCSDVKAGSATSAIAAWTGANFPADQILLGLAAYGHSFNVDPSKALDTSGKIASYPAFNPNTTVVSGTDACGNPMAANDVINYADLVRSGFLNTNGTAAEGIDYRYDDCSQTPYLYSKEINLMVSYDDTTSFAAKGNFILEKGLAGFSIWDATGDFNNNLLNAIDNAVDAKSAC